jgi:hypothetical protein
MFNNFSWDGPSVAMALAIGALILWQIRNHFSHKAEIKAARVGLETAAQHGSDKDKAKGAKAK